MAFNKYDFEADKVYRMLMHKCGIEIPLYIPLYHGSVNKQIKPQFGLGKHKHDYGSGFYTTFDLELAKEWAVCTSEEDGYVHKFYLDTTDLSILNFNDVYSVLTWLAILAMHRIPSNSNTYSENAELLIDRYYDKEIEDYDVIVGYRADDSHFAIVKNIIRGDVNISLAEKLLKTGELGDQIFIQSEKAFSKLQEVDMCEDGYFEKVDAKVYKKKYDYRDSNARDIARRIMKESYGDRSDRIGKYIRLEDV